MSAGRWGWLKARRLCVFFIAALLIAMPFEISVGLADVTAVLSYDADGNLIQDQAYSYEYDSLNQLTKVKSGGSVVSEYLYDESGNRIKKIDHSSGSTTYYFGDLVRVINSSGTYDTIYYWIDDELYARKDPDGKMFYYHPDYLGSTNLITDDQGNVVERTDYMPFGEVILGGSDRYGFTGQEDDKESELMYYGARYYSSFLRQFTQPDTMLPDIYDPQQLNRYAYARNNPVKLKDENGRSPTLVTALIGAGIGALIGGGISFGIQMWKSGGQINKVDWSDVGKSAAVGAISGGVAGLTMGIGNAAIGAAGLTGSAATAGEAAVVVSSSVASGQVSRAGFNVAEGNKITEGLGNPSDIAVDSAIGLATFGAGSIIHSNYIKNSWSAQSSGTSESAALYHFKKHVTDIIGKNGRGPMSLLSYTGKSQKFLKNFVNGNLADEVLAKEIILSDGSVGIKIQSITTSEMGIYTMEGKTVSYHPQR